ncbi:MAG: 2-isopropylmalate synthase [Clostridia bacterium]
MIRIFDTTLRDGEQSPGCSMNLHEKVEVAKQLELLKVDIIEAGFAIASPDDLNAISEIAKVVKDSTVCSLARCTKGDIDAAYQAVQYAASPRIHTFLATSPIHMEYKLQMKPDDVVEQAIAMVKYAKKYVEDVQFSAEDAFRSDKDFLCRIFSEVIKAGATTVNIPDTVGYGTPFEMQEFFSYLANHTDGIEKAIMSTHCHNDLGMAVSNSLAAVMGGARQIECTVNGIGERAGNCSLEEVVMSLNTRRDYFKEGTRIDTKAIYRSSRLIETITGVSISPTKAIVGANAFAHESGIHQHGVLKNPETYEIMTPESVGIPKNSMVLGKHSGRHAFVDRLNELGFKLEGAELDEAFAYFKRLADKKKTLTDADIEAIVTDRQLNLNEKYKYVDFVINSGDTITSTAVVKVEIDGEIVETVSIGDGPVDACFKAINMAIGKEVALKDYKLNAITGGEDAQAEAAVKLQNGTDEVVTGRGISTDVVKASVRAYINGLNKLFK